MLLCDQEHWTPKSRYTQTSRKQFIKQLTKIECWQTHIRQTRECLKSGSSSGPSPCEDVPASPESHHVISWTQNLPVGLGNFVCDPQWQAKTRLDLLAQQLCWEDAILYWHSLVEKFMLIDVGYHDVQWMQKISHLTMSIGEHVLTSLLH